MKKLLKRSQIKSAKLSTKELSIIKDLKDGKCSLYISNKGIGGITYFDGKKESISLSLIENLVQRSVIEETGIDFGAKYYCLKEKE